MPPCEPSTLDPETLAETCLGLSGMFTYPQHALPDLKFLGSGPFDGDQPPPFPSLESLQVEYTRLFINTLPEVPCPPYGSIYLEGCCMSGSTVSIQAIYRRAGIESDEMPDHFAVEMEFLGLLLPCLSNGTPEQRSDAVEIIQHLSAWTPEFFNRVEEHDRSGFYRHAAGIGKKTINPLNDFAARARQ